MSLGDYQRIDQSWEGKGSKNRKEKSAFEPYRYTSYRPYLMGYRDRNYGEFGRRENSAKYKVHPPDCDQCKYNELKRKSTSSLENIVLKLKKSRNDDEDMSLRIHNIDKVQDEVSHFTRHTPCFSRYPRCDIGIHHCSKCDYNNTKERENYLEKYSYDVNHINSERNYPEISEENEKSSFVTLLEQKDEMNQRNAMASILHPGNEKKDEQNLACCNDEKLQTGKNSVVNVDAERRDNSTDKSDDTDKITETKCDKCNKRFYRKSQLIRHISNHVVHECHKCNAFFYCVRKFKKHLTTHESYPCEFCDEEFYEASAWYQHRAKHTMVECSSCDMIFYNKTALLKHRFTHLQYVCPVCRFPFSNLNHWISHRSCHKTFGSTLLTPLFSCRECTTAFPSQDTYMKHVCIHRINKSRDMKGSMISKKDIADLIGVDRTAK